MFKKTKDDALGEFALFFVVIHLKDLLEGGGIDVVAAFWETGVSFLRLCRTRLVRNWFPSKDRGG